METSKYRKIVTIEVTIHKRTHKLIDNNYACTDINICIPSFCIGTLVVVLIKYL